MKIGGLQKLTLLDYPGYVACTIFTAGCNFRCPFCHNASLVTGKPYEDISEDEIFSFLSTRKGKLDGVCVTGGEPLLQKDLQQFIKKIKEMGFLVKLDTNGSFPDRLQKILATGTVDYVAMDIKNSEKEYGITSGIPWIDFGDIKKSVEILRESGIAHEFRTTVVKSLHSEKAFKWISENLSGNENYYLQYFVDSGDTVEKGLNPCEDAEMKRFLNALKQGFPNAEIRGK